VRVRGHLVEGEHGVTQASVSAKCAAHSSRVREANSSVNRLRTPASLRVVLEGQLLIGQPEPGQQGGEELRLDRATAT